MTANAALLRKAAQRFDTLKVDYLPLADLKPASRNARTHSAKQIAQIAASIRRFGFTAPSQLRNR